MSKNNNTNKDIEKKDESTEKIIKNSTSDVENKLYC